MNLPVAYQNYQQTQIETASPEKLLLMLYSAAVTRLEKGKQQLSDKRHAEAHATLVNVQDIVLELMVSLDWEANRELCSNLHSLYDYVYRRLVHANVHKEVEPVVEAITILSDLRDGWEEAIQNNDTKEAPPREIRKSRLNIQG